MISKDDIAIVVSGISLIVSIFALLQKKKIAKERNQLMKEIAISDQILKKRAELADHHQKYSELLSRNTKRLDENLLGLSDIARKTQGKIGEMLNRYDNDQAIYKKYLSNIFHELGETYSSAYDFELTHQSAINLKDRLYSITAEEEKNIKVMAYKKQSTFYRLVHYFFPKQMRPEDILHESSRFFVNIQMLLQRINPEKHQEVFKNIFPILAQYYHYFDKLENDLKDVIRELHDGLDKNRYETFSLRESDDLYWEYKKYLSGLEIIAELNLRDIKSLFKYDDIYSPVLYVVYIAGILAILGDYHVWGKRCSNELYNWR